MIILPITQDEYHRYVKIYFIQSVELLDWCIENGLGEPPIVDFDRQGSAWSIEFDNEPVAVAFKMRWLS